MRESEWLACPDARQMVRALHGRTTDRKLLLFVAAFWRWQADHLTGQAWMDLLARTVVLEHWAETGKLPKGRRRSASENVIFFASPYWAALNTAKAPYEWKNEHGRRAAALQPALLREVFGNPFRPPAAVEPAWLTWNESAAVRLAESIYEGQAFDRLPILADALEEAGCTDSEVLSHCRSAGSAGHVRGCWLLDLVRSVD